MSLGGGKGENGQAACGMLCFFLRIRKFTARSGQLISASVKRTCFFFALQKTEALSLEYGRLLCCRHQQRDAPWTMGRRETWAGEVDPKIATRCVPNFPFPCTLDTLLD